MNSTYVACFSFGAFAIFGGSAAASDPVLDALEGSWTAVGTIRGEAVAYRAEGSWALQDRFLVFSMIDANDPPAYEALVYIGRSENEGDLVAHWLDNFGADGARIVGFGRSSAQDFEINFDYDGATFRDRFAFKPGGDEFSLAIDARAGDGDWENFASYAFTRAD